MAGTYIRHNTECLTGTENDVKQPKQEPVSQKVSKIEYKVYNGDYERFDDAEPPVALTTQPDLLYGWNGDYIRHQIDLLPEEGLSEQFVTQSLYQKTDVNCNVIEVDDYEPYIWHDVNCDPITIDPDLIDPNSPSTYTGYSLSVGTFLADEDDRDNVIMAESDIYRIVLEDNTRVGAFVSESVPRAIAKPSITSEQDEKMITETDEFIIIQ